MKNTAAPNRSVHPYQQPLAGGLVQIGVGESPWGVVVPLGTAVDPAACRGVNLIVCEPVSGRDSELGLKDDDLDAVPRWLPSARAEVDAALLEIESAYPGAKLVLWPHAAGAISDAPSLRTFLRSRGVAAGGRWRFVYDASALLTPGMLGNAEDHLSRWSEVLLTHPDLAAVVVCEQSPMAVAASESVGMSGAALIQGGALTVPLLRSLGGLDPSVALIVVGEQDGIGLGEQERLLAAAGLW